MPNKYKTQTSIDFLSSYGAAILIIAVAIIAVAAFAFYNPAAQSCAAPPGFNCNFISIGRDGVLTAKISQALGTVITINGAACSDQQNLTTDAPRYGNVAVSAANPNMEYYPAALGEQGDYPPGNVIYSGGYYTLRVYCYQTGGSIASGQIGAQFSGYLWLNYSIQNYGPQVQKIAAFTAEYS